MSGWSLFGQGVFGAALWQVLWLTSRIIESHRRKEKIPALWALAVTAAPLCLMAGLVTYWVLRKSHDDGFAAFATGIAWMAVLVIANRIVPPYYDAARPANDESRQVGATLKRAYGWFSANRVIAICAVATFIVYLVRGR